MLSLPKAASATLRVVGIANTHTLTSSLSQSGEAILPFVKTLHFPPYTASQLLDVLNARLASVYNGEDKNETKSFLPLPALSLLTKKVASTTGDVRALFEVLRGAIDKAVSASDSSAGDTDSNTPIASTPIVTPAHILAAYKVYAPSVTCAKGGAVGSNSEVVTKVKNLGLQARLVFLSLLLASQRLRSGLSLSISPPPTPTKSGSAKSPSSISLLQNGTGIDATLLHVYYTSLLSRSEGGLFKPVGQSEFRDLLSMLEVVGLASSAGCSAPTSPVKGGKRAFSRSASFGGSKAQGQGQVVRLVADIRVEEALRGLGVGSGIEPADVKEEEVKSIWERESARSAREVKGKAAKAKTPQHADVLGGAVEDL
jgi:cell division control protein 6